MSSVRQLLSAAAIALTLAIASAPASATPDNFVVTLITSSLTYSGPDNDCCTHEVDASAGDTVNDYDNGTSGGERGLTSSFGSDLWPMIYEGGTGGIYSPLSFSFTVANTGPFAVVRENLGFQVSVLVSLIDEVGDFMANLSFALPDFGVDGFFRASFTLFDFEPAPASANERVTQVFAANDATGGSGLWLLGLVPDPEFSDIGGPPVSVPEPGALSLLVVGLFVGALAMRRRLRGLKAR